MALLVYKIAGLHGLAGIALQKGGVIAVRHKADVLAVVLAGIDKFVLLRDGTHLGLVQSTQRQALYQGDVVLGGGTITRVEK